MLLMVFYAQTITKEHTTNNTKSKPQHNCRYIIEAEIIIVSIAVVFIYNACYNIEICVNALLNDNNEYILLKLNRNYVRSHIS